MPLTDGDLLFRYVRRIEALKEALADYFVHDNGGPRPSMKSQDLAQEVAIELGGTPERPKDV